MFCHSRRKTLVTGATGFVGMALIKYLMGKDRFSPVAVVRKQQVVLPIEVPTTYMAEIDMNTDWGSVLEGVDFVVHTAARVHVFNEEVYDPLAEFRRVNVDGTLTLARKAARAGVRRFIFISSIGVNGNQNSCPFTENDLPRPVNPYAISKMEAEDRLRQLADESGLEVVIIRPPLVYGSNAPGNFGRLFSTVAKGIPLPLGAIHNKRSLVALDNLVDLIVTCIDHPAAANQTFLAGDGEDLSTTELLQRMAKALGRPARLIPVPTKLLEVGATLIGKQNIAQRLCGSLQVDISKARDVLGWTPPISVDEGLRRTVQGVKKPRVVETDALCGGGVVVKRLFDFVVAFVALFILAIPILVVAVLVKLTSPGPALYWSDRVGRNNVIFKMPKFRSMRIDTPAVATHLLPDPKSALTPVGDFLRKTSLDELPQLLSILKGDMSLVGPRPALFNQDDLIALRTEQGVHRLLPGLTGWAQINGRDELPIPQKVELDVEYLQRQSFWFDIKILWLTALKVLRKEGVTH